MLESGQRGYVGFGSDIGGYNTDYKAGPLGRTKELFLRWTVVGALSSYMENGGDGEHQPWKFDNEAVDFYRGWVNLHYALVPYLYTQGTKMALFHNGSLMTPCDDIQCFLTHAYYFGPSTYVVSVLCDPSQGQTQRVWLSSSPTNQWVSVFNASVTHKARTYIEEDTSRLDRIPFYTQQGTLMPMYALELSQKLDAYKFVLWGASIKAHGATMPSLFTRNEQEWLLEFDHLRKRLTARFIHWHRSDEDKQPTRIQYTWRFCQHASERPTCTSKVQQLEDNTWLEFENLV